MVDMMQVKTPLGKLMWVVIAGEGRKNLNDKYEFSASVVLPVSEVQPLLDQITEYYNANTEKGRNFQSNGVRYCNEEGKLKDAEDVAYNKKTGTHCIVGFKTATTFPRKDGKPGDPKTIQVYNSKGAPIALPPGKRIGNGSTGTIAGNARYYVNTSNDGVSLYLNAVQLVDFKEYSQDPGFEEHDGGFEGFTPDFITGEETAVPKL